ncbi:hypothetical protein [Megasphaera massiliensis]|uniref:hypothetical protein n=1 Tax=Megasphaera massiliensis TaxID=1232428 RepID=UPI00210DD0E1|nr:hypothetical protein [Megasphaera massiliensis]MCQ5209272.1 hypothetical protein [Megasphaera massiliensis]
MAAAKEAWNERYRIESRFRIPEQALSSTKIYKTPDEALAQAARDVREYIVLVDLKTEKSIGLLFETEYDAVMYAANH